MSIYYIIITNILLLIAFTLGALSFRAGIKHGFFILKGYYPTPETKSQKNVEEEKESEPKKDWTD